MMPGQRPGLPRKPRTVPGQPATPMADGMNPAGKVPGGPKGLAPGLGGAPRGQGGTHRAAVAGLRRRLAGKGLPKGRLPRS